jgi:hypothetical protein
MAIFIPEAINGIEYLFLKEESYNIVSSRPRPSWIRTHNVSGDRQIA